ncbi:MAG: hypothetical protein IKE49_04840 [Firmicutes bacterium]|nr:hypothetical protein [Bacillota bacterium]
MMNSISRKIIALLLIPVFMLSMMAMMTYTTADQAYAKEYKYKVTVYSGQQGHFKTGKVWSKTCKAGERVYISTKTLGFKLDNKKYYVRGFRIAGHDNDESSGYRTLSFKVDRDVSYEVAYAMKGNMVGYVVRYQDTSGKELHKSDSFYGMAGDKPVVAYRYIDGYIPEAYYLGKTLSKDESKNVFTFRYIRLEGGGENGGNGNGNNGNNGNGNNGGNAGQNNGPAAPGTVANPAGNNGMNPASDASDNADTQNIGDNDTPQADQPDQYQDIDDNDTPLAVAKNHLWLIILIALIILLLIIILLLLKRRKKRNEQDAEQIDDLIKEADEMLNSELNEEQISEIKDDLTDNTSNDQHQL